MIHVTLCFYQDIRSAVSYSRHHRVILAGKTFTGQLALGSWTGQLVLPVGRWGLLLLSLFGRDYYLHSEVGGWPWLDSTVGWCCWLCSEVRWTHYLGSEITSGQKESQAVFLDRAVPLAGIHNQAVLWAVICNYSSLSEASGYVPN